MKMQTYGSKLRGAITAGVSLVLLTAATPFYAETTVTPVDPAPPAAEAPVMLTATELDALVAPIALYPDDLIAIVLPASTYPLQVVQAARFLDQVKTDSTLKPDEAWDDSVVALTNYPEVVDLLNGDLDWTWKLGQAVVNQQPDVLAAVEDFRRRANTAGNLKTDTRQVVTVTPEVVEVKPADPQVIYVPYYEPAQVTVYQPYPVYHYYPVAYPVYYYPYPDDYAFGWPYFWGVTTFYSLGWSSHHVHVHNYYDYGHPYYAHRYWWDRHYYRRPYHGWHGENHHGHDNHWNGNNWAHNDWHGRRGGSDWQHDWNRGGARPGDWNRRDGHRSDGHRSDGHRSDGDRDGNRDWNRNGDGNRWAGRDANGGSRGDWNSGARDGSRNERGSWTRERSDGAQTRGVTRPSRQANAQLASATTPQRTRWNTDGARAPRNSERGARQMSAQRQATNVPRTSNDRRNSDSAGWHRGMPSNSLAEGRSTADRSATWRTNPGAQRRNDNTQRRPAENRPPRQQVAQVQRSEVRPAPQRVRSETRARPERSFQPQRNQAPRAQERSAPPQRAERRDNGGQQAQRVASRDANGERGGGNRGGRGDGGGRGWQSRHD